MAQKYRSSSILEEREGYSLVANSPHLAAEIAMQASSHAEALLRGKEQLNGYDPSSSGAMFIEDRKGSHKTDSDFLMAIATFREETLV